MKIEEISPLQMLVSSLVLGLLVVFGLPMVFGEPTELSIFLLLLTGGGLGAFLAYWSYRRPSAEINETVKEAGEEDE